MKLKTQAIVLRDYKMEDDRILTLLSREHGVITAYAGGANRMRSRLAGSTELLCYSEFVLFQNRDKRSVDSADPIRTFFGLRGDVENLALAAYFAELAGELAGTDNCGEMLRLLLNTLHYLEKSMRDRETLKPLYELRILTMAGYMPNLVACSGCSRYEADFMRFLPKHGELLCPDCPAGTESEIHIPASVLAAMRHIIYCDMEKLFSFSLAEDSLRHLGNVTEYYLKYQLEKTFPTLEFYNTLSILEAGEN